MSFGFVFFNLLFEKCVNSSVSISLTVNAVGTGKSSDEDDSLKLCFDSRFFGGMILDVLWCPGVSFLR